MIDQEQEPRQAAKKLRELKAPRVRARIESLLKADLSDAELRERLEELSRAQAFDGFTWLWGPRLYRRNRVMFRPFILSHFSTTLIKGIWRWEEIKWKGETGRRLDAWFEEVDRADDAELFRRLYQWKHSRRWGGFDESGWRTELLQRFRDAGSPAKRRIVLDKFDVWGRLDQTTVMRLYRRDPLAAGPFILKHLDAGWDERRKLWDKLFDEARRRNDDDFAFQLYRRQVSLKQWEADVRRLAEEIADPAELCAELKRRHPEGWDLDLSKVFYRLVKKRGPDVFPYVQPHVRSVFRSFWGGSRDSYTKLVALAAENEWWGLWSALVRTCSHPDEFNTEVKRLLDQRETLGDAETRHRLLLLSGISREWNFGPFGLAQVQQFDDATAVRIYQCFPDLLRGPFKMNVSAGWDTFPKLADAVIKKSDDVLIDYLASRMVTRADLPWGRKQQTKAADRLSRYYEQFREDDEEFSRRSVSVLGQVPAYSVWNYPELIRTNRLARMFYERSSTKYLATPDGIRDLLEAPEIHAQAVAFRALGLDDDAARALAAENLDLLQATLLRPLHRQTRVLAFRALENAAVDLERAERIHARCREALDLPDTRYPKEQLVGLIGRLLHKWPELRSPSEQRVVYGATA